MKSIRDNVTYKLDVPPVGKKPIGSRWGFRKKLKPDGTIDRYEARLVAKGFMQKKGQEYNETFAPVAKYKSIRMLLAIAAHSGWKVYHDDAKNAFLNGILKETIYMDQPEGYPEKSSEFKWKLIKTLYGLKQSPREWNEVLQGYLHAQEFKQCVTDPCLYVRNS
jgi:hypothetical protein